MPFEEIRITGHAQERMTERKVSLDHIKEVLKTGIQTGDMPDATPFPKYTKVCPINNRLINVVAADNKKARLTIIITVF